MKITTTDWPDPREVYTLYWSECRGVMQRMFLYIPEDGYPGFLAAAESDSVVVDDTTDDLVAVTNSDGKELWVHRILEADRGLLDQIIDHDPEAMRRFQARLAESD